ncbi:MAG TPA: oligosaccharide flippase family protein [Gaiellaceae bacterium]|jgi:O-antigen/teichoic acid export membrane protein|nr:oligosaccharide flippase family protein [Gaiellaceae bacterium]
MARRKAPVSEGNNALVANIAARVAALVSLSLATLVVARTTGPSGVGIYALLRVLPGLVGVVISAGLPGAATYFLAGPDRKNRRLPLTIVAMALSGGLLGTMLWAAVAPLLQHALFSRLSLGLVLLAGVTVLTQLVVATAKSCSQGTSDLPGANRVIVNEELMFLPAYGALWAVGLHGYAASIWGLLIADVATFVLAWSRLAKKGFFRRAVRPSAILARRIAGYGLRAQVGGIVTLLNLRLDFLLISIFAGPAVLGVYAVASKFAELLKVPPLALTYVLYPRYARLDQTTAAAQARRLLPRAGILTAAAIVPLWIAATFLIPALYGSEFEGAITPAHIILVGLALEGVAAVITAFLYGIGRPGLNSWGMAAGLAATVVLDVLLIPPFGAIGAATASAIAYATSALALVSFFRWVNRPERPSEPMPEAMKAA